jgi:toxin ParE1/3/4
MRVVIREAAYDDLDRIYAWIAKDRPRSADTVIERILESAERLGRFPYMGHVGATSGTYEWVVPGLPYILVYQVRENDGLVLVDAVFHGAQDRGRKRK